jgi:hypothetical protein
MKQLGTVCMIVCLALCLGCAAKNNAPPSHPGAASSFDSQTADVLLDTQNVLEGLSAHVSDYPKAVGPLNEARATYTTLKTDYLLWRCTQKDANGNPITTTLGPNGAPCPDIGSQGAVTQATVEADKVKTQQAVAAAQAAETGAKKP